MNSLIIKNMVCPRCITAVSDVFKRRDILIGDIQLGKVQVTETISASKLQKLSQDLNELGFELLQDNVSQEISKLKSLIVEQIHYSTQSINLNFSAWLSSKMNKDYSYLSKLFSSVEGITIEKYIITQRIEKVKELLLYKKLNFNQIADAVGYSSSSHLSNQFKKETGMTPSQFQKLGGKRTSLDKL